VSLGSRLRGGLAVASEPRTVGAAVVLTVAAWSMSVLAFAAAGQAIGVQLTIGEAAFLSAGVALATAIPSAPGYLGTFELAAKGLAETFGLPGDGAFALALLAHAGILFVTSAGGAIAVIRFGWAGAGGATGTVRAEPGLSRPESSGGRASR
ncbi:MAG TPA: lysylphosphatidylglycerol synthase domain-containing protein, partial [Candidatus Limnocylindrales bacterium]